MNSGEGTAKPTVIENFDKVLFNDSEHFKGFLNDVTSKDPILGLSLDREYEHINDLTVRENIKSSILNYINNSRSQIDFNKAISAIEPLIFLSDGDSKLEELSVKLLIKLLAISRLNFGIPKNFVLKFESVLASIENDNENLNILHTYFKVYSYSLTANDKKLNDDIETYLTSKYFPLLKRVTEKDSFAPEAVRKIYVLIRSAEQLVNLNSLYKSVFIKYDNLFADILFGKIVFNKSYNLSNNSDGSIFSPNAIFSNGTTKKSVNTLPPTNSLSTQLQYYTLVLIWVLTFDSKFAGVITNKYQSYALKLINLVNSSSKLKVTRVCLAILQQLITSNKSFLDKVIIYENSDVILNNLSNRNLQDDELNESLKFLLENYNERKNKLNNIQTYKLELNSKKLNWTSNHITLKFWEENITQFKINNYELVHKLLDLIPQRQVSAHSHHKVASPSLSSSQGNSTQATSNNTPAEEDDFLSPEEKLTVQVALNDLSKIMELLPDAIDVAISKNKLKIMGYLSYPDKKIKYEALKCTQVLIKSTYK